MATHLRLHRDTPSSPEEQDGPVTYRFPVSMAAARRTLVAGIVNVQPVPGAPSRPRSGVIARIDRNGAGRDCMTTTDSLVRDVERTLARMQARLDHLKADVDEEVDSYKFPEIVDEGPRAA